MDYLQIVDLVFYIMSLLLGILTVHFALFFLAGLFAKKKFPHTDKKLKYGIIIPARNEEAVVGNLIKSVYKNNYPQDKLQVFVIAHNCTDKTAQISKELGATVYEYNNDNERTMGYAFRYLFDRIKEDWGIENYDGFFLFNADNILDENYFEKMNDAFVANDCKKVITSFRNSKNFGTNVISALYGMLFMQGCRFESRGRTVLGCSTRVQGTGYVVSSEVVKNGWPYVTLTEDWEFTVDQILKNNKIEFCDDAVFYDEQPTSVKIMFRQRLRWEKGHMLVCVTRFKHLLKGLFKPKSKGGCAHKGSLYDITVNIMPISVMSLALFVVQAILLAFAPLLGFEPIPIWINWAWGLLKSVGVFYAGTFITAIMLLIVERKRIKNVSVWLKIVTLFVWPLFIFLSVPLQVIAIFKKNVGWKTIPHDDKTTFEHLNEKSATTAENSQKQEIKQ